MWTLPRSDLKFRLTLRIVAVAALCFAATSAYALFDADRSARTRIDAIADLTAKDLELQQSKMDWIRGQPSLFPDLQNIATALMAPGLCIAYRVEGGDILQRICGGTRGDDADPPTVFVALYRTLFDPGREAVRSVLFRDKKVGEAAAAQRLELPFGERRLAGRRRLGERRAAEPLRKAERARRAI
jgi:hypothetical protein